MKTKSLSRRSFVSETLAASVGLVSSGVMLSSSPAVAEVIPTSIQRFIDRWDAAWDNHDPVALGALHTNDQVTINRYGTLIEGRAEVVRRFGFLLTKGGPLSEVSFPRQQILRVRMLGAAIAIVQTKWQSPEIDPHGMVLPDAVDDMLLTYVLMREGDDWKAKQVDTHDVVKSQQH